MSVKEGLSGREGEGWKEMIVRCDKDSACYEYTH
jgi:hypothetical protein